MLEADSWKSVTLDRGQVCGGGVVVTARRSILAYPPGRSGAAPSRRSNLEREGVDYAEDEADDGQEHVGSTGAPLPGAVVIDLVSDEEEDRARAGTSSF